MDKTDKMIEDATLATLKVAMKISEARGVCLRCILTRLANRTAQAIVEGHLVHARDMEDMEDMEDEPTDEEVEMVRAMLGKLFGGKP